MRQETYTGKTYKTAKGTVLLFIDGAERWLGPWPGMSWDILYDEYIPKYISLPEYSSKSPSVFIGPDRDYCRETIVDGDYNEYIKLIISRRYNEAKKLLVKEQCNNITNYEFCSFECWYLSEKQALLHSDKYAKYHRLDSRTQYNKLRHFENVFRPIKNRWEQYRHKSVDSQA